MINIGDCIILADNQENNDQEYLCFDQAELEDKKYLFLMATSEPHIIRFAEEATIDGATNARIIEELATKQQLAAILQEKIKTLTRTA